jgi:hypothetical protein
VRRRDVGPREPRRQWPLRRELVGASAVVGCLGIAVLTFSLILGLAYGCS